MINEKTKTASVSDIVELCAAYGLGVCARETANGIASVRRGYSLAVVILGSGSDRRVAFAEFGQVRGETSACRIPAALRGEPHGLSIDRSRKPSAQVAFLIADAIRAQVIGGRVGIRQHGDWAWPVDVRAASGRVEKAGQATLEQREVLAQLKQLAIERQAIIDDRRRAKGQETSAERKRRLAAAREAKRAGRPPRPTKEAKARERQKKVEDRGQKLLAALTKQAATRKARTIAAARKTMRPVAKMAHEAARTPSDEQRARLLAEIAQRRNVAQGMLDSLLEHQRALRTSLANLNLPGFTFRPISDEDAAKQMAQWSELVRPQLVEKHRRQLEREKTAAAKAAKAAAAKVAKAEAKAEKARIAEDRRVQKAMAKRPKTFRQRVRTLKAA